MEEENGGDEELEVNQRDKLMEEVKNRNSEKWVSYCMEMLPLGGRDEVIIQIKIDRKIKMQEETWQKWD